MMNIFKSIGLMLLVAIILALSVRGSMGNPGINELTSKSYKEQSVFELSPERGRFALAYSLVENGSFALSIPVARFVTPDVAYYNGEYVSLFAPGVSLLIVPGYLLGKMLGASQVGTYAIIAFFAFVNFFLVQNCARLIGASHRASLVGAIMFLFATPAFAYAVNLYQHHISVFIILLSIYLLLRWPEQLVSRMVVWLLIGASIIIDYPNAFLVAPLALYTFFTSFDIKKLKERLNILINIPKVLITAVIIIPLVLFLTLNVLSYDNPFQLAGSLNSVDYIDDRGNPITMGTLNGQTVNMFEHLEAVGNPHGVFFDTRNILNGLYTHFLSQDRGIFFYTPITLIALFGVYVMHTQKHKFLSILLAIVGVNIILYSMWGDPWGGWAFGSRYLIPTYAIAGIFLSIFITHFPRRWFVYIAVSVLMPYSIAVNTLGALTTSKLPPRVQVLELEELSGREEKYTYSRNIDYLRNTGSQSFVYQTFGHHIVSAQSYYVILVAMLCCFTFFQLFGAHQSRKEHVLFKHKKYGKKK